MSLKITKIKPLFTGLLTTMERYEDDVRAGSLIDATRTKGTIKEYQTVVAVGPAVRDIKIGDKVMINPQRYAIVDHKSNPNSLKDGIIGDTASVTYSFDVVTMNDEDYLYLQDRDIMYVFEGEEKSDIIDIPEKTIMI